MRNRDKSISIFILAGGKSSRMGKEKGMAHLQGKPMIQYLIEATSSLGWSQTIIGQNPDYLRFGIPLISDLIPDKGSLGGIYTALDSCRASHALILSCDSPLIQPQTLKKFIEASEDEILVGQLGGRIYPFPGIYPKSLQPVIRKNLDSDRLKVQEFILKSHHKAIYWEEVSAQPDQEFANFNSPEDLMLWEKQLKFIR